VEAGAGSEREPGSGRGASGRAEDHAARGGDVQVRVRAHGGRRPLRRELRHRAARGDEQEPLWQHLQFVDEAYNGEPSVGFSYLPRGYYQLKEGIALPQANAEGIREFNFVDGTTVWWLTRGGALPFRFVTKREFLNKQIEIVRSKSTPRPGLLAYYQRLLGDATDDVAFVKETQVPGLTETGFVFTTLEDRANRIYVTVNPDYYDRSQPKSAPQHILIRLKRADEAFLNRRGNGARHLESFQKLREIVRANLPELRAMVK
jgi:hypothetical protein